MNGFMKCSHGLIWTKHKKRSEGSFVLLWNWLHSNRTSLTNAEKDIWLFFATINQTPNRLCISTIFVFLSTNGNTFAATDLSRILNRLLPFYLDIFTHNFFAKFQCLIDTANNKKYPFLIWTTQFECNRGQKCGNSIDLIHDVFFSLLHLTEL